LTVPPTLSELDPEVESEPELSRLTVVVGGLRLDMGLPANASIATFIGDVIDIANHQLTLANSGPVSDRPHTVEPRFDADAGMWTLAKFGGEPIDPHRSLSEAGVFDGDLLMVHEVGRPVGHMLFDDVEQLDEEATAPLMGWLAANAASLTCFGIALVATTVLAVASARSSHPWIPLMGLGLGVLGVICGCVASRRPGPASQSTWVVAVSLPLVFICSSFAVPEMSGVPSIPMAATFTALCATLGLAVSGSGRALYATVIASSVFAGVAAACSVIWDPPARTVGALLATSAVIIVYLAPRVTIMLSKLPLPRVPTAGEPLDDIETHGGIAVEGVNAVGKQFIPTEEDLVRRVRRANEYLTGILIAAASAALCGCYLAVDVTGGFFWQGTAFAAVVATVLCLRGRSHHDLIQSATLIGSGVVIALGAIAKTGAYLEGWHVNAMAALVALAGIAVACGVVAPRRDFSPVIRRQVEIVELIAIAMVFPLCFWIIRLYAFFRELRI
jgi:type VII secretion integral membrane protein EccD